jgi:hypothetical protein
MDGLINESSNLQLKEVDLVEELTFSQKAAAIVQRTAKFGLIESQVSTRSFERWLLIWTCDIAGEIGELASSGNAIEANTEAGDVIWGITALCLLLEIPCPMVFTPEPIDTGLGMHDSIIESLLLLDYCKKICRDGQHVRPIDKKKITLHLMTIWAFLSANYDVDEALDLVNAKLLKRYPDGFSAEKSVNRES